MTRYARLVEIARLERELIQAQRYDALEPLEAERTELMATLPPVAPEEALRDLLELAEVAEANAELLSQQLQAVSAELAGVRRARALARSYGLGSPRPALDAEA